MASSDSIVTPSVGPRPSHPPRPVVCSRLARGILCLGLLGVGLLALPGCSGSSVHPSGVPEGHPIVRLASDVWPPFTDVVGRPRVAIDLVHGALERAGYRTESRIEREFRRVLYRLQIRDLDGSAAMWRTPEREETLLFSRPYLENRLVLVGRSGTDVSAESFAEIGPQRVAVVGSYAYGPELESAAAPTIIEGATDRENLRRLLDGEVDLVLIDELVLHHLFARYGARAERRLAVGSTPIVRRTLHFAVRRDHSDAEKIIADFEEHIGAMLEDGSFHRALGVDWIRADLDGDGELELVLGGNQAGTEPPADGYELFSIEDPRRTADPRQKYRIEGKTYHTWNDVPHRFKTPIDSSTSETRPEFIIADF